MQSMLIGVSPSTAHERIMESDLAAAQANLADAPAGSLGGGSRVDGERQRQQALIAAENARLTQVAGAKDAALDDARASFCRPRWPPRRPNARGSTVNWPAPASGCRARQQRKAGSLRQ
jgi:hypothetical protein